MEDIERETFTTKRGRDVHIWCRAKTNDRMVAEAVIQQDEYKCRALGSVQGTVVDVGAHIGSWLCLMLVDWQLLEGVAIEPLPVNVELMQRNLAENGLTDRATIIEGVLAKGTKPLNVSWNFSGSEMAEMHRYIGDQRMTAGTKRDVVQAKPYSVAKVVKAAGGEVAVMKLDCEGGESALIGSNLSHIGVLVGEYHFDPGALFRHLGKTHEVKSEGDEGIGSFVAIRKG